MTLSASPSSPARDRPSVSSLVDVLRVRASDPASRMRGVRFLDRRGKEEWVSWCRLINRALEVAHSLRVVGLEPGNRVALVLQTEPAFLEAFFGVLLSGAVAVPLYPPLRLGKKGEYEARTASLLGVSGARLLLSSASVLRRLDGTLARQPMELGAHPLEAIGPQEVQTRPARSKEGPRADSPFDLEWSQRSTGAEDLALVQFSSGTTGAPKPVALSHRALLAQARILDNFWPDTEEVHHSGVSWLPLYHDMGLIGCVLPALLRPADLTLLRPELFVVRPASWLRAISRYRATISAAPNFAYALCVEKVRDEQLEGVDLSCWRAALNGAEAVAPRVLRAFVDRFARFGFREEALTPVYGLAEASLAVTFGPLDQRFRAERFHRGALAQGLAQITSDGEPSVELASVGRPVPGFEVEIRETRGAVLGEGEVGKIWVQGPSLMSGYLGLPRETDESLRDGWLDTGDLGFVLEEELFLCGREKDVLVLNGRNWAPEPVEEAMAKVEGVEPGAVVAITFLPEGGDQEELWLFAEEGFGSRPSPKEVAREGRRQILAETGLLAAEVRLLRPRTLPRTSSGKLRRRRTLEAYLAGELELSAEPSRVGPPQGKTAPMDRAPLHRAADE